MLPGRNVALARSIRHVRVRLTVCMHYFAAVIDMSGVGGPQSRRIVSGLGRAELEDKHLSLLDENHVRSFREFSCNSH